MGIGRELKRIGKIFWGSTVGKRDGKGRLEIWWEAIGSKDLCENAGKEKK